MKPHKYEDEIVALMREVYELKPPLSVSQFRLHLREILDYVEKDLTEKIRADLQAEKKQDMTGFVGITEKAKELVKKLKL